MDELWKEIQSNDIRYVDIEGSTIHSYVHIHIGEATKVHLK